MNTPLSIHDAQKRATAQSPLEVSVRQVQTSSGHTLNTDSYSEGYFLGCIGAEPAYPEDDSYCPERTN